MRCAYNLEDSPKPLVKFLTLRHVLKLP